MYQTPTAIWNEIAASQPLSQPWFDLFRMDFEELTKALEPMEKKLEMQGVDSTVIRAYLLTAPLLVENEAVSSYIEMTERHDLRNCLPEICSVNEAVILATREYRLNPSQQARLTKLLKKAIQEAHQVTPTDQDLFRENELKQAPRSSTPSKEQLIQAALRLIEERILSKGGKMPSERSVQIAANLLGLKAHKELQAREQNNN